MSKFNDSYERLYEYWSYGEAIDYNVEKQLDDWVTIHREYTRLSKALDKACDAIAWLSDASNCDSTECENCKYKDSGNCTANSKEQWKEWLLNDGIKQK